MRTLVDLVNAEHGYARIFYEDSFGYELHVYRPGSMSDLFERMTGYASVLEACDAARTQLSAMAPRIKSKDRKAAKSSSGSAGSKAGNRPARGGSRRRQDGGSIGLL
ncbi:MAG TPA: hypothetical protein VGN07_13940 [Steroidobacteraceae bacterium]|jgi:hypothetical protein